MEQMTTCSQERMSNEIFLSNGFSFDVFALFTPTIVDSEICFLECRNLWTLVPVGNVVGVATTIGDLPGSSSCVNSSLVRVIGGDWVDYRAY